MSVAGVQEMITRMRGLRTGYGAAGERAMTKFGRVEMAEMKRITPVETGELVDSGFYGIEISFGLIRLIMGFAAHHAIFVHEDLEAFHVRGQAKFFEIPWNESSPHFLERVAADIKKDLGL